MTQKEIYEKVDLLRDGQVVQIEGDFFKAVRLPDYWDECPCNICKLDSICRGDVTNVCSELDGFRPYKWYLKLAHP